MVDPTLKRWAQTWDSTGKAMDSLRQRELQAMTDDDVRRAIADLFAGTLLLDLPARTTSGLVEQQRLFARVRQRA